jgi:tripeptide aminopeptidase
MTTVKERFIRYVKMDTKSNRDESSCPSSPGQFVFARQLVEELKSIGLTEVSLDGNCDGNPSCQYD